VEASLSGGVLYVNVLGVRVSSLLGVFGLSKLPDFRVCDVYSLIAISHFR